ncbi:uncharacterized protein LOC131248318 isoform X2 [Magnolia sinica]|uniref:uncharacterized protein LOC131248318 isoform X2 n=1 Tax=Magnolia sinica TaxID=86752 RepID=UPI00265B0CF1|nr:uncharacterized protein LOC131248318 isoform X2 [Magnolia sinica]
MDSWAQLENIQTRILQRITELELALSRQHLSVPSQTDHQHQDSTSDTESRLSTILKAGGVRYFSFKRVPFDYYDRSVEDRREILSAPTVDHLCKSIVLVNTQAHASVSDCSNPNNSKYYVVVIQYTARLNAENVKNFLYSINNGKIPKKKFNPWKIVVLRARRDCALGPNPEVKYVNIGT